MKHEVRGPAFPTRGVARRSVKAMVLLFLLIWWWSSSAAGRPVRAQTAGPYIFTTPSRYFVTPGSFIEVHWTGPTYEVSDWIGLYQVGASAADRLDWLYINTCSKNQLPTPQATSATANTNILCRYWMPADLVPDTQYEWRLYNARTELLATSNMLTVPPNKALGKRVGGNSSGTCAADTPPAKAINGAWSTLSDKWCNRASGLRWLGIDFGGTAMVYGMVIRHAGVREASAYNTRSFKVYTGIDGSTWEYAWGKSSNTAAITQHYLSNGAAARFIDLRITEGAQSGQPNIARIYEVEVFATPYLALSVAQAAAGQTIEVRWSGVENANRLDWIGLYPVPHYQGPIPGPYDYSTFVYTNSCTTAPGTESRASGVCTLQLPAAAGNYHVRLFAGSFYGGPLKHLATSGLVQVQ